VLAAAGALVATAAVIGGHASSSSTSDAAASKASGRQVSLGSATRSPAADAADGGSTTKSPATALSTSTDGVSDESARSDAGRGSTGSDGGSTDLGPIQPKVVRTASMELQVRRGTFADAVQRLSTTATGVGGFVSSSETSQLGDDPRGSITIRVPAKDFDRVMSRVADLGKVAAVTTDSQDVTGEYTDVAARIKSLQDERDQIQLVLSHAESIPDILSVRDRLSAVQSELEQLQGRQQVLDDQTSLSTITITLSEQGRTPAPITKPAPPRTGISRVWHEAAGRFGDGARDIAVGFASMAPWLLLAAVLWLPARGLWRRLVVVPQAPAPTGAAGADREAAAPVEAT
jgi:hypothetical protein